MANPHLSTGFGDLLDPRFQKIFFENLRQLSDMVPVVYDMVPTNGRDTMRWSGVGTLPNWDQFSGSVNYQNMVQAYDTIQTPLEFASGVQVERKLFDDDQYNIMDSRPRALSTSYVRTRQEDASRILNNAFSNDTLFYVNSEGVSLCNNSHTTNSGASTSNGFDNLNTSALTATSVQAARIQMRNFRGDQAEKITVTPNELWIPIDLFAEAQEIVESMGKTNTANNNINVNKGVYTIHEWEYLTDTNNWFMTDSVTRKEMLHWQDRIPVEFAFAEDLDTIIAKWRGYARYGMDYTDWRWILGAQVS